MDPSSLIFVVIIGIWAVYLVQHWVRRREQLATSRSLDRFSDAMRVLERRAPIPVPLPVSKNRPYVVAPARPLPQQATAARPEVAMKQAALARSDRPSFSTGGQRPTGGQHPTGAQRPAGRSGARSAPARRTHRLRGLVLLTLLVATPAVWAAHLFGTLLLWPTLTVTAALVLDLFVVRSGVRRDAAARRMAARRMAAAPPSAPRPAPRRRSGSVGTAGTSGSAAKTFPVAQTRTRTRTRNEPTPLAGASRAVPSMATSALAVEDVKPVHSQDAITEVIVLDGGWEPVAVPPPTYAMKARAERPAGSATTNLAADSDSAPSREPLQPAVAIDDLDLDSVLDRRRAAGE